MKKITRLTWGTILCGLFLIGRVAAQPDTPTGNPLLPGYFADPTIKKFGDTYYIYATTDGIKLASGEPSVWISKDFVNWFNYKLDLKVPEGLTNCWAPDISGRRGKYYNFMGNCQFGCNIYGYVPTAYGADHPDQSGKALIPAGTACPNLPAL
jgi:beta-xylosidase